MSSTTSITEFANKFREELLVDLQLMSSISCPKCCITYVDNDYEDCCRYERISSSSKKEEEEEEVITKEVLARDYELVCVFDYYDTKIEEVISLWKEKVLKDCYEVGGEELKEKWRLKLNSEIYHNE